MWRRREERRRGIFSLFTWTTNSRCCELAAPQPGQPGRVTLDKIKTTIRQTDWRFGLQMRSACCTPSTVAAATGLQSRPGVCLLDPSVCPASRPNFTLHILIHHHPSTSSSNRPFHDTRFHLHHRGIPKEYIWLRPHLYRESAAVCSDARERHAAALRPALLL